MVEADQAYRCTLTPAGTAARIHADRALAARVVDTERTRDGVRVTFTPGTETRKLVDAFVAHESRCCGFFHFAVTHTDRAVTLELTAPPDEAAQALVEAAKEAFDLDPAAVGAMRTRGTTDD